MPLRFEHHAQPEPGRLRLGFKIFAGKMEIGHIWKDEKFGDNDVRWDWTINQISMSTLRSIAGGSTQSAEDAKRDADYVWSMWVSAAGLKEASNAPPD